MLFMHIAYTDLCNIKSGIEEGLRKSKIFGSGIDLMSILGRWLFLLMLIFFLLLGRPLQKSQASSFQIVLVEIWHDCSSSKYASTDGVRFLTWCHTFQMASVTLFHAEKCCHLVSAREASAQRICSSVWQFVPLCA